MKNNKIIKFIFLIFIFVFSLTIFGCDQKTNTQTISVGDTIKLDCNEDCVWSSSNNEVATVNSEGIVKGVSRGKVKIYAKTSTDEYTIDLNVYDKTASKIIVNCKQTLKIGDKEVVNPKVSGNTSHYTYSYSSNDSTVISVTNNEINAVGVGIATLTVKAISSQEELSKEIVFYVYDTKEDGTIITNVVEKKTYEITGEYDLSKLNNKITNIVSENKDSIIGVSNFQEVYDFFGRKSTKESGVGTGFVIKKEKSLNDNTYYALTNYHVIEGNKYIKVYFGYTKEYVDSEVLFSDSDLDLALIKFSSDKDLKVLEFAEEDSVTVGDFAIAIGNANGYQYFGTTTFGIISYVDRQLEGETSVYLQHDVAINPGNSGGPLFDVNGKVIGINTLKIVDDSVDNIGFAITINTVKSFLNDNNFDI